LWTPRKSEKHGKLRRSERSVPLETGGVTRKIVSIEIKAEAAAVEEAAESA
jgi:hypothetical protein